MTVSWVVVYTKVVQMGTARGSDVSHATIAGHLPETMDEKHDVAWVQFGVVWFSVSRKK